jgi:hypothetical protein
MNLPHIRPVLERFISRQPADIREFLWTYHRDLDRKFRRYSKKPYPWLLMPSWRILPSMLAQRLRSEGASGKLPRGFLRDVRWGQYCLYLCFRYQDDLFDDESDSRVAVFAADICLAEAGRVFTLHFPGDPWFWKAYHEGLRITAGSIVEVDRLQQKPGVRLEALLEGYARVAEVLKVGTAAVCSKMGREDLYPLLSRFCDEMAKAGQIVDDLRDLEEDLERGRHNCVAAIVSSRSKSGRAKAGGAHPLLDGLLFLSARETALQMARDHIERAARAVEGLSLPGMKAYITRYLSALAEAG